MTELAAAVDDNDELWTLDALPTPEAPYVEVEDELVEVRSRFPSSYYTLTGETLPPRIRVRRGIAGTTKASHIQGSTLTPNYGLGGGAGGGAIAVDNTVDPPAEVTTLIAPGAILAGDEATLLTSALRASVEDPVVIQAAAGSENAGSPIFMVLGETGEILMSLDAYGNLNLRGPSVDPTNDGASLLIQGPPATDAVFRVDCDDVNANARVTIGGPVSKVGFYNATPVAKATGVAVTAEAIHAALVSLGLIAGP